MTIAEIKKTMTDAFISDPEIIAKYELEAGKTFDEQFSVVSLESILFFIVATAHWIFGYNMLDQHKKDITNVLYENKAHKNQWYATMAKLFQYGHKLNPDTDTYDNSNLTEAQIESSRIVKFAAAVQPKDKSILYIKVATEVNGQKQPLSAAQLTAFKAYLIDEVPDAGVRIEIINAPADAMRLEIDIYYNALVLDDTGKRLDGSGDTTIQDAIRNYLSNLSFNGLYTNQSLVDVLQTIEGVEQAELIAAYSRYGTYTEFQKINARSIPYAGYYAVADNNLIINFIANEEYI